VKESQECIARYLYYDCSCENFSKIKRKLELMLMDKENPLIVLDNCKYEEAIEVIKLKRRYSSNNARIITIWNQFDKNNIPDYVYLNLNIDLNDVLMVYH